MSTPKCIYQQLEIEATDNFETLEAAYSAKLKDKDLPLAAKKALQEAYSQVDEPSKLQGYYQEYLSQRLQYLERDKEVKQGETNAINKCNAELETV